MRSKFKVITLAVAVTAAAAGITVGAVSATGTTNVNVQAGAVAPADLRDVLIPADQQAGTVIGDGVSLQDAVASGLLQPDGYSFSPQSCIDYLDEAVGGLDSKTGWVQYGTRPDHPDHHIWGHTVLTVPGGVDINRIRAGAATCRTGTVTLDDKVTGALTYTEIVTPALPGATTFGIVASARYPQVATIADSEAAAVLQKYGEGTEEVCAETVVYVAMGDLLIEVVEPTSDLAFDNARTLYDRALLETAR